MLISVDFWFCWRRERGAGYGSQPVSWLDESKKISGLRVFFEEKGEVGAVWAGAEGFVLVEKLA